MESVYVDGAVKKRNEKVEYFLERCLQAACWQDPRASYCFYQVESGRRECSYLAYSARNYLVRVPRVFHPVPVSVKAM